MSYEGARAFTSAFRNLGVDAHLVPEGDERTLELASRYTSGDECLPARVTLGNFLKITESPGFDPARTAFFMPTAGGPCRLGQYAPYMEMIFSEIGYDELMVVSPTSKDGYRELGDIVGDFMKLGWLGLVGSDALRKLLHKYRPYQTEQGGADRAHMESLDDFCSVLEDDSIPVKEMPERLAESLGRARDRFRRVPVDWDREVFLVGVVGEIFCRLSTFSNEDLIRKLEKFGGQAWLSDISEWIWYTDEEFAWWLRLKGKKLSLDMARNKIKKFMQHRYEQTLLEPLREEFAGLQEPHSVREVLEHSRPYLPPEGSKGEMVLSVGKAIYLYRKGVDAIIDISPFTCMNGIISEAVYPAVSRDHDDIPIKTFYFDGTSTDLENDLEIFMELARNYNRRKKVKRSAVRAG